MTQPLKDDWVPKDTPGHTAVDWTYTPTAANAVASRINMLDAAVHSVAKFGAVGDGITDDTAAIEAAWAANDGLIHFPAGTWIYNGTGLAHVQAAISGASRAKTIIKLGASSYLIQNAERIDSIELSNLSVFYGKGAIKLTWTGQNSNAIHLINNVKFRYYTECAIAHNSADMPYWHIEDCNFDALDTVNTIGIALSGLTDASLIDRCVFENNRIHIKLRAGGNNAHVSKCGFLWKSNDNSGGARANVWLVPTPTLTNSGSGLTIDQSKFDNLGKAAGDKIILYADELTGTSNGAMMPNLAADSTGYVVGHQIMHNSLHGTDTAPVPLVYSTTPNVFHLDIAHINMQGTPPTYLIEFRTPSTVVPDRLNQQNTFGPFTGMVCTENQPAPMVSNVAGVAHVIDPNQILETRPNMVRGRSSGSSATYRELLSAGINTFSVSSVTLSAQTDAYGAADATLLTYSGAGGACYHTLSAMTVAQPVWIEFDIKRAASGTPLDQLRVYIQDSSSFYHWRRVVAVPAAVDGWVTYAFTFTPRTVGATHGLFFSNNADDVLGTVIVGRPRVYHAHERQIGGRRPAALTGSPSSGQLANDLRTSLINLGVLSGDPTALPFIGNDSRAYFSAAKLANGNLPDTGVLDSGHPYVVTHSGATGWTIASGALQAAVAVCYLNFGPLRGTVCEFSMEVSWTDSSQATDDTAVIVVADAPFANNYPTSYANAGCHLMLHRDWWNFQKRAAAGPGVSLASHYYTTPVAYGERNQLGMKWDGHQITILHKDGSTVVPYDSDVEAWMGAYACAEIVSATSGYNKVNIHSFTAASEISIPNAAVALRDANANLRANNFIANSTSTATDGSTTTLDASSTQVQAYTGNTTHTTTLPTTGVKAGQPYLIINNKSAGNVYVQPSATGAMVSLSIGTSSLFIALVDTPTTAAHWHVYAPSTLASGGLIAQRDSNANLFADNFIATATSQATAASTLTMTINSAQTQVFTGTTAGQVVKLPTTSVVIGQGYTIVNNSNQSIALQSSNAEAVATVVAGAACRVMAVGTTPTTAAHWKVLSNA